MPSNRLRRRRPHERDTFGVPLNQHTGPKPGPEVLPWYWHPDRDGAQPPPAAFAKQLAEIDPDIKVCFSPVHERYLIWVRNPRIGADPASTAHWMCKGWQLLMLWEHPTTHEFLPLSELLFHNLVLIRATSHPSAVAYFNKIQDGIDKAKASLNASIDNDREAQQADWRQSMQISTAGKGNKFALHHDGTMVPGPAEQAWRAPPPMRSGRKRTTGKSSTTAGKP